MRDKSKTIAKRTATRRRNAAKRRATAIGRLSLDEGASSLHMNRRLLWLAIEWQLPRAPNVGRTVNQELVNYCQSHGVSMNWLVSGRLSDLRQMLRDRKQQMATATPDALAANLRRLSDTERNLVRRIVQEMLPPIA